MVSERNKVVWSVVVLLIGMTLGAGGITLMIQNRPVPIEIRPPEPTPEPEPTVTPGPIRVYVNGQVVTPAVYFLPPGSIVKEAIEAAGGFAEGANTKVVNLAQPLSDGLHIYVPSLDDADEQPEDVINNPVLNQETPGLTAPIDSGDLVNINSAPLEVLDTLPGIGPALAQRILDYRNEHGQFKRIEEIMDVSGIGEAKFAQLEGLITVGEVTP